MSPSATVDPAAVDWPRLPTETEIYILPDGRVIIADLPAELADCLPGLGEVEPCSPLEVGGVDCHNDLQWEAIFASEEGRNMLDRLAAEALADIRTGKTNPMIFTANGEIAPG